MTQLATINNGSKAVAIYGSETEIAELADRIRRMLPGGNRYTPEEALMLSQFSHISNLNAFNGECWLLVSDKDNKHQNYGVCVGIKGLRRHGTLQMKEVSGNYWITFRQINDPAERKFLLIPDQAPAFEARLFDTATLRQYGESYSLLKNNGVPHEAIAQILGLQPYVSGVGYYKPGEQSKMTPVQCAMFRAEKDALKRRFILPFGAVEAVEEDAGEIIEGTSTRIEHVMPEAHQSQTAGSPVGMTEAQHADNASALGRNDDESLLDADAGDKAKALDTDAPLKLRNQINENNGTTDTKLISAWYEAAFGMASLRNLTAEMDENKRIPGQSTIRQVKQFALNLALACVRYDEEQAA